MSPPLREKLISNRPLSRTREEASSRTTMPASGAAFFFAAARRALRSALTASSLSGPAWSGPRVAEKPIHLTLPSFQRASTQCWEGTALPSASVSVKVPCSFIVPLAKGTPQLWPSLYAGVLSIQCRSTDSACRPVQQASAASRSTILFIRIFGCFDYTNVIKNR